jgi:dual oxidase
MRQQYKQLPIGKAEIYPSDVIYIQFKRPDSFNFRSGQWVRISCPNFKYSFNKHHAFSIASAPQSPKIELYIKAVGPWTWQLRHEIIEARSNGMPLPLINLQGPYGAGNQVSHSSSYSDYNLLGMAKLRRCRHGWRRNWCNAVCINPNGLG